MDIKDFDVDDLKTAITEALNSPYDIEDAIIVVKIREEYKENYSLDKFYDKVLNNLKNTYNMEKEFNVRVRVCIYIDTRITAETKGDAWEKVAEEIGVQSLGYENSFQVDTGNLDQNNTIVTAEDIIDEEWEQITEITENE